MKPQRPQRTGNENRGINMDEQKEASEGRECIVCEDGKTITFMRPAEPTSPDASEESVNCATPGCNYMKFKDQVCTKCNRNTPVPPPEGRLLTQSELFDARRPVSVFASTPEIWKAIAIAQDAKTAAHTQAGVLWWQQVAGDRLTRLADMQAQVDAAEAYYQDTADELMVARAALATYKETDGTNSPTA